MKFGIAAKLGVVLAAVGMLAAGIAGFYAYSASKGLLVQSAREDLLTSTRVLARRITLVREEISLTVRALARHPAAGAALEDANSAHAAELGRLFALLLEANPAYFQIRLIAADGHGRERVRADRDGSAVVHVTGDDLQEKGHYPYVFDTLRLAVGEVYMSRIAINQERGSHAALRQPTVQFATPVADAAGIVRGVIVINVDLNGVFALLAADLPPEFQLFLTNGSGDYLIHPDASRAFGFDKGRRVRVQDEFPAAAALVDGQVSDLVIEAPQGPHAHTAVVAAFITAQAQVNTEEGRFMLGLAQPLDSILERATPLGHVVLQIVIGLSLLGGQAGNQRAFAVADQDQPIKCRVSLKLLRPADGIADIARDAQVAFIRRSGAAGGYTALVVAQAGDALLGQALGQAFEAVVMPAFRVVAVTVGGAGAGNQQGNRYRRSAAGFE